MPSRVLGFWFLCGVVRNGYAAEKMVSTGGPVQGTQVVQVLLGLVLVLAIIGALAWFARRFVAIQPAVNGQLRVLGGLSMGAREKVVLVEVGETQLLLGVAPGRIQTLHVLDRPLSRAGSEPRRPASFAGLLKRSTDARTEAAES